MSDFSDRLAELMRGAAATSDSGETAAQPDVTMAQSDHESAKDILELLELEMTAMVRQLERAANSVSMGAESTAATLSAIRNRTEALNGRSSDAQTTAQTFSQSAAKFTQSAFSIGMQVRDASKLADDASAAARESAGTRRTSRSDTA